MFYSNTSQMSTYFLYQTLLKTDYTNLTHEFKTSQQLNAMKSFWVTSLQRFGDSSRGLLGCDAV